jgi:putative ABC transport system permease protein
VRAIRFALLALSRDWRSGELAVLLAALLVAVTALTGVGFFTDRISQAVDQRSAEPLPATYEALASERDIETARIVSFPSVVFFGEDSALTAIRAVGPGYPLRGRLKIADEPFAPARETDDLPGPGETWLDSRLLARLGARVGDSVNIGASAFRVTRVLDYRPDQGSAFTDPRLRCSSRSRSCLRPSCSAPAAARRIRCSSRAGRPMSASSAKCWPGKKRKGSASSASTRRAPRCNHRPSARAGS